MAATNSLLQVDGLGELAAAMSPATFASTKKNFLVYRDPHHYSKHGTRAHFMTHVSLNLML